MWIQKQRLFGDSVTRVQYDYTTDVGRRQAAAVPPAVELARVLDEFENTSLRTRQGTGLFFLTYRITGSRYSPNISRNTPHISPKVA